MDAVAFDLAVSIETAQEDDGRWLAEVAELPGVMAYGDTEQEAQAKAESMALSVLAERFQRTVTGRPAEEISADMRTRLEARRKELPSRRRPADA
jgi:predicted RNase H-like HicB family nuclease